jgi:small GTP-binding protein
MIVRHGERLSRFFRVMTAADVTTLKLIVIGDSSVGKTQMMLRFTDDSFSTSTTATIGVDFKGKNIQIEGVPYRIQIWDTAGQERFRNITEAYYRKANGIAIVFDSSHRDSFVSIPTWFESVAIRCSGTDSVPIVLIGNKSDLEPQITYDEGLETATKYGAPFFQTSAKTGSGIEDAFMDLATRVAKDNEARKMAMALGPNVSLDKSQGKETKKTFRC